MRGCLLEEFVRPLHLTQAWKITAWVDEMSTYIKSLDANHLVATGDEGFLCETYQVRPSGGGAATYLSSKSGLSGIVTALYAPRSVVVPRRNMRLLLWHGCPQLYSPPGH